MSTAERSACARQPATRQARLDRARWRCRRGMKELDVLLERFAERGLERLEDSDLDALERLLDAPDQDILGWLASASATPPTGMHGIVSLIRSLALPKTGTFHGMCKQLGIDPSDL